MSVESHSADMLATEPLHLPEPARRVVPAFAGQAEEVSRSDCRGVDIAEIEQQVVSAASATGLTLLKGPIEAQDDDAGSIHQPRNWGLLLRHL